MLGELVEAFTFEQFILAKIKVLSIKLAAIEAKLNDACSSTIQEVGAGRRQRESCRSELNALNACLSMALGDFIEKKQVLIATGFPSDCLIECPPPYEDFLAHRYRDSIHITQNSAKS